MAKSKKSKKKFFIFGALAVLLLVVIALVVFGGDNEKIVSVQIEKVNNRTITQVVSATGKIHPEYQVELRPEVTGEVVELPVEEGDIVQKGQLLIRIKPEQYIAQRNRARASLESAKANLKVREAVLERVDAEYKRVQGLFEKGLASEQDIENAKSEYLQNQGSYESQIALVMQSQESLNDAQEQMDKTTIYSPIHGKVTALNVELSERVLGSSFSQGTHLMTVANLSKMEARVEVDENDIVLISVGDTTNVDIDAFGDRKFRGIVSQIGNSAKTSGSGTQDEVVNFEVRVRLLDLDDNIRPGMSCDTDIETETKVNVVSVPIQSVTARVDKPKVEKSEEGDEDAPAVKNGRKNKPKEVVFVNDNGTAKQILVETGISDDTYIEIKSGLEGGEEVIIGPYRAISKELEEGTKLMLPKAKKDKKAKSDSTEVGEDKDSTKAE
ncbi:MAG: efflux RND transporter periplasmic adaptor subunit [Bacteroidetes bacterium]|nr:efflux RND transporter periplasmic adaptor subunit [Bacteroidota bacterium]MBU1677870.1 efflux RND transporter periplasmic adaptor subunit [Bacteroidota bacterium]MBU2505940.1 efflux RND transporter periplasmic adaptor subunit [Bacteroidota bacterium]